MTVGVGRGTGLMTCPYGDGIGAVSGARAADSCRPEIESESGVKMLDKELIR